MKKSKSAETDTIEGVDKKIISSLKTKGLTLREHQKVGISKILAWKRANRGAILADEMGLGKTCQAALMMWQSYIDGDGPFFVVCPLSVTEHFSLEITRFSCGELKSVLYVGNDPERKKILEKNTRNGGLERNVVFVTAYHTLRSDAKAIKSIHETTPFTGVILDEAQNVKSANTLNYRVASLFLPSWYLLMTGTPIQNNLQELFTLLSLILPNEYPVDKVEDFVDEYNVKDKKHVTKLKEILASCMLRRTKEEVSKDLPFCEQVILYHGITEKQKQIYMDLMAREHEKLRGVMNGKTVSLVNLLMQLRKCVGHPYLFNGIEPQPFVEGEHLVKASGKLQMLDRLLKYLKSHGHRCLIFSQFRILLDIIQDYMELRKYKYERLDGSVKGEDRFEAVRRFHDEKTEPFAFLLTTKAGGVGLNLVGADTAIFLDSDWNPQNDIQAMARCHRIGQNKPVRVIRLVGRYTVEQYLQQMARSKLKLTAALMEEGDVKTQAASVALDAVKTGLKQLTAYEYSDASEIKTNVLEQVIGKTDPTGSWLPLDEELEDSKENSEKWFERVKNVDEVDAVDVDAKDYLVFQGKDYRVATVEDEDVFAELLKRGSEAKYKAPARQLSAEELAALKEERAQAAADRVRRRLERLEQKWKDNGYESKSLPAPEPQEDDDDYLNNLGEGVDTKYVFGDVTLPVIGRDHVDLNIIVHVVDNGGTFGTGGVFSALRDKDERIAERYEMISEMQDLKLGDVHLVENVEENREPLQTVAARAAKRVTTNARQLLYEDDEEENEEHAGEGRRDEGRAIEAETSTTSKRIPETIALLVAQNFRNRDTIRWEHLESCFSKLSHYVLHCDKKIAVHFPRIGYGLRNVSWYTVERMIRKYFSGRGIATTVYYYRRRRANADAGTTGHRPVDRKRPEQKRNRVSGDSGDEEATTSKLRKRNQRKRTPSEDFENTSQSGSESSEYESESDEYEPDESDHEEVEGSEEESNVSEEDSEMEADDSDDEKVDSRSDRKKKKGLTKERHVKGKHSNTPSRYRPSNAHVRHEETVRDDSASGSADSNGVGVDFSEVIAYVFGCNPSVTERFRTLVNELGGVVVRGDNFDREEITHVIVDRNVLVPVGPMNRLVPLGESDEWLRRQYGSDALCVTSDWMYECLKNYNYVEPDRFIV